METTPRKQPLVSYDSVASACQSLIDGGQRPSVRLVISTLGGGSPNAILQHLNMWKASRPAVKAADVNIDPRINAILAEQITASVIEATRAAEQRAADLEADANAVAEAGRAAEQRVEELMAELADAQNRLQQMTGRLAALTEENEELKAEGARAVAEARAEAQRERDRAEGANRALARAELRLESLPVLEKQLDSLRGELATVRAELAVEHSKTAESEKGRAVATAEKGAADGQVAELRVRLKESEVREAALRQELTDQRTAHERAMEKLTASLGDLATAAAKRESRAGDKQEQPR